MSIKSSNQIIQIIYILLVMCNLYSCEYKDQQSLKVIFPQMVKVDTVGLKFSPKESHIFLTHVEINNKRYQFVFDTGAEKSIISNRLLNCSIEKRK